MGMFDEVHTGLRCGQTKALGKTGARYAAGDQVRLVPAPMDAEAYESYLTGSPEPVADTFQVAMHEGGFLTVRDTILTGWDDQRDPGLPLYDNLGRPVEADQLDSAGNLPVGYYYIHTAAARIAQLQAGRPGPSEDVLAGLLTGDHRAFSDLDPVVDAAVIAERQASARAEAGFEEQSALGLPGTCGTCAAVLEGRVEQLRAEQTLRRDQVRARARARRLRDDSPADQGTDSSDE